jgi:hypothetical protein
VQRGFCYNGAYVPAIMFLQTLCAGWMDFMNGFVVSFGRKCIDLVHASGKVLICFMMTIGWYEPYGRSTRILILTD